VYDDIKLDATLPITVASQAGDTLSGTTVLTPTSGRVTFTNVTPTKAATTHKLIATHSTVTRTMLTAYTVVAGASVFELLFCHDVSGVCRLLIRPLCWIGHCVDSARELLVVQRATECYANRWCCSISSAVCGDLRSVHQHQAGRN
jgi:hypothetical protein